MPKAPLINTDKLLREFPPGNRYLIGVSGGRDSVALLQQLSSVGYQRLIVCHLNHQLRGRSSGADARFVEKLAAKYALDFATRSTDVKKLATRRKMSIETAARSARYVFFAQTARRYRCDKLFLAHHADDLVETFLINLFRGSGTAGLAGIRAASDHQIGDVMVRVLRPLLGVWRKDIDSYVKKHRLPFREDASNESLTALRNRIRHRVLPYLEKTVARNIRQNIWRTAMILADEEDFFRDSLRTTNVDSVELALKNVRQMGVALQRRALHTWLRGADIANVGFDVIERVRGLLDSADGPAKTNLSGGRHVRRRGGKLFID